jgi:hypothetical protein
MSQTICDKSRYLDFAYELAGAKTAREANALIDRFAKNFGISSTNPDFRRADGGGLPTDPYAVGIWRRSEVEGEVCYVRDNHAPFEHMWSTADRISLKRGRSRVVLLGESVARAWPLDPLFNCASCLTSQIRCLAQGDGIDVVDLARSGIEADGLIQLLNSASVIEPDIYVVFAGNNWGFDPTGVDLARMAQLLRDDSAWHGIAAYLEEVYRQQIRFSVSRIARVAAAQGVPVIFVIPGVNLRDWTLNKGCHSPIISTGDRRRCESLVAEIDAALAEQRIAGAEMLSRELMEIEGGVSPAGLQALARCALARGAWSEAVDSFERAWNTGLRLLIPPFSAFSLRIDELRRAVAAENMAMVDVPRLLLDANKGFPPGRECFFDGVHMTPRAIRVAMAGLTEKIATHFGLRLPDSCNLSLVPASIEDKAPAQAHFVAVFYNGYAEQHRELVRYHAEQAIQMGGQSMCALIRAYVDRGIRRCSDALCRSFHDLRVLAAEYPIINHFLNLSTGTAKRQDLSLMQILINSLAVKMPSAADRFESLIRIEHAPSRRQIDVVNDSGYVQPRLNSGSAPPDRSYFACHQQEMSIPFICERVPNSLFLCLTTRVSSLASVGKEVSLLLNGVPLQQWPATNMWYTFRLEIDSTMLKDAMNVFTIVWPDPESSRQDRIHDVAAILESKAGIPMRTLPDIYVRYGEVHGFLVGPPASRGGQQ